MLTEKIDDYLIGVRSITYYYTFEYATIFILCIFLYAQSFTLHKNAKSMNLITLN